MLDQIEKRRLCPMDVVEHDDECASASHRLQEPARRVEAVLGSGAPLGEADELGDTLGDERGLRFVAHELDESCLALLDGRRVVEPGEILDRLEQRPERDAVPVGQTAATGDECARGDVFEEVPGEPRLADARGPEHREELARAVGNRLLERVVQPPPFAVATDHRGEKATALRRCGPARRVVESRLSRFGLQSKPGRGRERLAGRAERVLRRVSAGEHRAGAHADPDHGLRGSITVCQAALNLAGCPRGSKRVVFVDDREAEDGGHGIPRGRLDRPSVGLDGSRDFSEGAGQHAPENLGIEPFFAFGYHREMHMEGRDGLPFRTRIRRRIGAEGRIGRLRWGGVHRLRRRLDVERGILPEDRLLELTELA